MPKLARNAVFVGSRARSNGASSEAAARARAVFLVRRESNVSSDLCGARKIRPETSGRPGAPEPEVGGATRRGAVEAGRGEQAKRGAVVAGAPGHPVGSWRQIRAIR